MRESVDRGAVGGTLTVASAGCIFHLSEINYELAWIARFSDFTVSKSSTSRRVEHRTRTTVVDHVYEQCAMTNL